MKQRSYNEMSSIAYDDVLYTEPFRRAGRKADKICFPEHYHDRMELLRMQKGRMEVHIDGEVYEAREGDLIIVNPNQSHTGFALTDSVDFDMITFELVSLNNNSFAYQKYLDPLVNHRIVFSNVFTHPEVICAADELFRSYGDGKTSHLLHKISMIYHILGLFYQYCPFVERALFKNANIDTVLMYIREHFDEPLTVRELSRRFGYNENYFSRMFKKNTEMSVSQYIQAIRLERAKRLLSETDENVTAIALLCGYSDVFYFSNRFKRYTGRSPQQFRARNRKNATQTAGEESGDR